MSNPTPAGRDGLATAAGDAAEGVLAIVHDVLGHDRVGLDDDVFDCGATSLSFVRVLAQIKSTFGVMVHAAELGEATPRSLAVAIGAQPSRPAAEMGV